MSKPDIHEVGRLSSRPHLYRRLNWFERLCERLDCHPALAVILTICMGYVAILLAWCVRHMATGAW
jgi:hypothetical protein